MDPYIIYHVTQVSEPVSYTHLDVYKRQTLIRPVVTYGDETCTLTKKEQVTLRRFERKIVRRVYGAAKEDDAGI